MNLADALAAFDKVEMNLEKLESACSIVASYHPTRIGLRESTHEQA